MMEKNRNKKLYTLFIIFHLWTFYTQISSFKSKVKMFLRNTISFLDRECLSIDLYISDYTIVEKITEEKINVKAVCTQLLFPKITSMHRY